MRLEDLEENLGEQIAAHAKHPDPELAEEPAAKPPRKSGGRRPLPAHLARELVVHEPEIICNCGSCDPARLVKIGETTTEVLEKIPAKLKVIRHVRPKYACRLCEAVFEAPAPELPIEKGRPGPGLLANVAVSKYCDGVPLYRQSVILEREGIEIDRATMAEWMGHVAWWVLPLAERIGEYVMGQGVIWTDDTPIRTLAPGTGKTRLARFWCYAVDPRPYAGAGHPAAFYRYSPDRKGERPRSHLEGFSGYLHADAFAGYDALYRQTEQSRRGSPTSPVWRMRAVSSSTCSTRPSHRSPRKLCGGSKSSMRSRRRSTASPPVSVRPHDRRAASRCSRPSTPGRWRSDDGSLARHRWARLCSHAQPVGCPDSLSRGRSAQHRQQPLRAAPEGNCHIQKELFVPGLRSRRRTGRGDLYDHRVRKTQQP